MTIVDILCTLYIEMEIFPRLNFLFFPNLFVLDSRFYPHFVWRLQTNKYFVFEAYRISVLYVLTPAAFTLLQDHECNFVREIFRRGKTRKIIKNTR